MAKPVVVVVDKDLVTPEMRALVRKGIVSSVTCRDNVYMARYNVNKGTLRKIDKQFRKDMGE